MLKKPIEFDIFAPDILEDPAPVYNELRERARVVYHPVPAGECYVITRSADIWKLKRAVGVLSARHGNIPLPDGSFRGGLYNDPPSHSQFRRIFAEPHSSTGIARLEAAMHEVIGDLIGRVQHRGECDLVKDVVHHFPGEIVGRMIGAHPDRRSSFTDWTQELLMGTNTHDASRVADLWDTVMRYFGELIDEREEMLRNAGSVDLLSAIGSILPDDLASRVVVANLTDRPMPRIEQQRLLQHQMVGGSDTSIALIANAIWRLLQGPGLCAQVRRDPSLDEMVVEESLRYDPPAVGVYATNDQEIELDGVTIPRGSRLFTLHMAGNRDPRTWEDPDVFRLDRDIGDTRRKTHTFSGGVHTCQGARLARAEGRIAVRAVLDALPGLRMNGPTTRNPINLMWGRVTLPIAWDVTTPDPTTT